MEPNPLGGLTPAQIRWFYGLGANPTFTVNGHSYAADGTGQTIAIVDEYNDPDLFADVDTFDRDFSDSLTGSPSLHFAYGSDVNWLKVYSAWRTPPNAPTNSDWALETTLDVEWAHAIAPGAKIDLVEGNPMAFANNSLNCFQTMNQAANYARQLPNVSVVSMSYGTTEAALVSAMAAPGRSAAQMAQSAAQLEAQSDSIYTTPANHTPVTFVAATGDNGAIPQMVNGALAGGPYYPSTSPNVLAVGGTIIGYDAFGNIGEEGWSGSGGGISLESKPTYQGGVQVTGHRTVPDVSYDAGSGVLIVDSYTPIRLPNGQYSSLQPAWGTSAGAPQWAGLLAIANEGRAKSGKTSLDGAGQVLPALYSPAMAGDFHDILYGYNGTNGLNGYYAHTGYDLVTGLGTPVTTNVINYLAFNVGNWAQSHGMNWSAVSSTGNSAAFASGQTSMGLPFANDAESNSEFPVAAANQDHPLSRPSRRMRQATVDFALEAFAANRDGLPAY